MGRRPRTRAAALGTFKEAFRLEWQPALALDLIHAGRWGTTVEAAAAAKARARGGRAGERRRAGGAWPTRSCSPTSRTRWTACCARSPTRPRWIATPRDLMAAVPPLAGILRYGDVRGSDTSAVAGVLRGIVLRSAVGLPGRGRRRRRGDGREARRRSSTASTARSRCWRTRRSPARWREALRRVADGDRLPGHRSPAAPPGCCTTPASTDPAAAMSRALSPGEEPERGASWIEGFIGTSGLVLVHDPDLLAILDELDRLRRPGRVHERPPAPAPRLLRPARGRAPPPRRTPPRT